MKSKRGGEEIDYQLFETLAVLNVGEIIRRGSKGRETVLNNDKCLACMDLPS